MDDFKVKVPQDFYGASLAEVEDEERFKYARPGDHLVTPFQCPCCQSENIRGKTLDPSDASDVAFEALCIRAYLDAFWSHASKTIAKHVSQVKFLEGYSQQLRLNPLPDLGPWPLGQHMGMLTAIMVLMRSKEPGRGDSTVKYGTARQVRSTLTVLWETSPDSGRDMVLSSASTRGRFITTLNPTESRWYQYFNTGLAARMGDVVRQDLAYTLGVLLELLSMFEDEWRSMRCDMPIEHLSACMFLLVACLGGMRGYEVVWTDLTALRHDVITCEETEDYEAVSWPVVGRFKNEQGKLGHHVIPIAGTTSRSNIQFFVWTQRFVGAIETKGITEGWAFQRSDGSRAKASDYRNNIFSKLEDIQQRTNLIDEDVNVWEDYGIQRSGRRFFVTESLNCGIPRHVIEAQCRWSTDRAKGNKTVTRSMMQHYSEVRNMKSVLIQPSKAF
mmetsp:Transcript_12603/g.21354  ORF Transcript_12603/g.21354 Transcript_12603/m.21354 type:complete len:444 (+) Transcript_12603:3911-5242(+)